jgi:hypothetical protein
VSNALTYCKPNFLRCSLIVRMGTYNLKVCLQRGLGQGIMPIKLKVSKESNLKSDNVLQSLNIDLATPLVPKTWLVSNQVFVHTTYVQPFRI